MQPNTNRKSNLPAIAFALATLVTAIPSAALAGDAPPTQRVSYGDLNLASEAGIEALDRRLDRAVKRVCGTADPRRIEQHTQIRECQEKAMADVAPQRRYVIARATGRVDGQGWAENASRGQTMVALSE